MVVYSRVTSEPDYTEIITISEAKAHLRVSGSSDDSYITTLINVAGKLSESYSGLSFVSQERRIKLDTFPCDDGEIIVPYGPVQTIDEFTYIDSDGVSPSMVPNTAYRLASHSELARLESIHGWPSTETRFNAVTIEYTAGYNNVGGPELPMTIKQAMLLQIGAMYENRQDEVIGTTPATLTMSSRMLLDTVKVYWHAGQD